MELIDTHCHLTFEQLADDVDSVIERSKAAGVTGWITVGTDPAENHKAVALAEKYDNLYAALAYHPHEAKNITEENLQQLKKSAQHKKVVSVGETGLDFHYDFSSPSEQAKLFTEHIKLAADLNLPLIIHSREAFDETLEILEKFDASLPRTVFHCFSYSAEQAKLLLDKGFYISFTGVVTFKSADSARNAARIVPLDRMMIETDCPYMSPAPMRKQKVNEPALLIHTAKFLAELKNIPLETFASEATQTSLKFFSLPVK